MNPYCFISTSLNLKFNFPALIKPFPLSLDLFFYLLLDCWRIVRASQARRFSDLKRDSERTRGRERVWEREYERDRQIDRYIDGGERICTTKPSKTWLPESFTSLLEHPFTAAVLPPQIERPDGGRPPGSLEPPLTAQKGLLSAGYAQID